MEFDIEIGDETLKARIDLEVCEAIEKRGSRLVGEMGLGYQGFPSAEFFVANSSQSFALMKIVLEEVLIAGGNAISSSANPPKMIGGKRLHVAEKGEKVKDLFEKYVESGGSLQSMGGILIKAHRDATTPKPKTEDPALVSDGSGDVEVGE